ncbi:MAG: bifunctional D-glycero-beta-D-manno-heptose-7-phosphate kinase/D-glycero-beta-D-manno-heptose 1-phosphate adenylyltransferase HldE [Methylophilaceae bacterium]|jgi:D-beta-D-heptose 7-phosphate kinase/D-beta-D-heptose 1-phosphate adenosyltransferase|nr:bifunctional D-glycero-beta-D-manno-heptose-7-phosphate kinase/D-glycero-beta-D-manno-heptose 1-phosphate adenylyltransferase HldE [Methylophilaceae bacterium]
MRETLIEAVKHRFVAEHRTALVIGDLMLDRYLIGEVERISPEAPVPVVLLKQENERAGGAANVAANLSLLGIRTTMAGIIGDDAEGRALLDMLRELNIDSAIVTSQQRPTVTKTRILGGHQQMMRLDKESRLAFTESENNALHEQVSQAIAQKPDVIILSDYAKGVLSDALCQAVIAQAKALGIPVLVDPKGRDYTKYQGATALTPNKKETSEACGIDAMDTDRLLQAAADLRDHLGLVFLAVTRGEEGISLLEQNETIHIPAAAKQVFDVSGAGDTVIATLAAGLVHGLSHRQAFELANIAAGIVVGKVGTVPVNREELLAELISQDSVEQADKICELETLLGRVRQWRQQKKRIVFTNGCFDLLHAGHVTYLEAARKTGDKLILGLNTDRSVSALKGPSRPVIHEADRARVLAALEAVDAVILFDEDTPLQLIDAIRPDVIVKGSDYSEDQVVGGKEVKSWGGKVALIDIVPGRSTSNIIEKLGA